MIQKHIKIWAQLEGVFSLYREDIIYNSFLRTTPLLFCSLKKAKYDLG